MSGAADPVIAGLEKAEKKATSPAAKKWFQEVREGILAERERIAAERAARGDPPEHVTRERQVLEAFNAKLATMREKEAVVDRINDGPPEAVLRKKAAAVIAFEEARAEVLRAGALVQRTLRRRMTREEWGGGFRVEATGTPAAPGGATGDTPTAKPGGAGDTPSPAAGHPAVPPGV